MRIIAFNKRRPRAVVPGPQLLSATVPVRCEPRHAAESPLPYGCAVMTENEDGIEGEAPMYWVSPKVAESRGRGVLSGWYVVARVGEYFDLHVANIKQDLDADSMKVVAAHVDVDGSNPLPSDKALLCQPGKEAIVRGFAESADYGAGATEGTLSVRRFRFAEADIGEDEKSEQSVGCVILRISQGRRQHTQLKEQHVRGLLSGTGKVEEKAAIKKGESVRVDRRGERMTEKLERAQFEVRMSEEVGRVVVFIRKKRWLQTRNILDKRGAVWKPQIATVAVDLTHIPDETDEERARKRKKLDVIDLTKIKDNVDLTQA